MKKIIRILMSSLSQQFCNREILCETPCIQTDFFRRAHLLSVIANCYELEITRILHLSYAIIKLNNSKSIDLNFDYVISTIPEKNWIIFSIKNLVFPFEKQKFISSQCILEVAWKKHSFCGNLNIAKRKKIHIKAFSDKGVLCKLTWYY